MRVFEDTVWLVTGAASGMGRATTVQAVAAGATVIAADINESGLSSLSAELGERCIPFALDVGSELEVSKVPQLIDSLGGRLDVLVNNAGTARLEKVVELTSQAIDAQYQVLLRGPMLLTSVLLPHLQQSKIANIVNISSIGAIVNVPHHAAYAAFKAALEKFSRITLRECRGVRVNLIQPGFIDTQLLRNYGTEEELRNTLAQVADRVPAGRVGVADDVANVVLFLASPSASYINGAEILVDGGYCAGPFDFLA